MVQTLDGEKVRIYYDPSEARVSVRSGTERAPPGSCMVWPKGRADPKWEPTEIVVDVVVARAAEAFDLIGDAVADPGARRWLADPAGGGRALVQAHGRWSPDGAFAVDIGIIGERQPGKRSWDERRPCSRHELRKATGRPCGQVLPFPHHD